MRNASKCYVLGTVMYTDVHRPKTKGQKLFECRKSRTNSTLAVCSPPMRLELCQLYCSRQSGACNRMSRTVALDLCNYTGKYLHQAFQPLHVRRLWSCDNSMTKVAVCCSTCLRTYCTKIQFPSNFPQKHHKSISMFGHLHGRIFCILCNWFLDVTNTHGLQPTARPGTLWYRIEGSSSLAKRPDLGIVLLMVQMKVSLCTTSE